MPKTAYKVVSVDEEHPLTREFRAEIIQQSLIDNSIDKLDCKFPGGATRALYFDASILLRVMKAQIEGAKS